MRERAEAGTALPPSALPLAADAVLEQRAGRHHVRYRIPIPYFGFFWRPLMARRARRIEAAADAGRPLPSRVPWWAPPVPQDQAITTTIACMALISGCWSYGGGTGGLLTQTLPYAADVYDVGDSTLAVGLSVVRIGVLLALALGLIADRVGRRRFVVTAAVVHCLLTAVIGFMPTFDTYIAAHIVLRMVDVALGVAIGVLAMELVPAGNRAMTLALLFLAGGAGLALAVGSLPIAAAGRGGFAIVYVLQLLALPLVLSAGRRLRESPRYLAHAQEPHRYRELLDPAYRGRLALFGGTSLLSAIFFAPGTEFFNRYLDDVHHFSSFEIVLFLAITGGPAAIAVVAGGRLADTRGRKVTGVPLVTAATFCFAGFFLTSGPWLWVFALLGSTLGAAGLSALSVYGQEMFPTRVRSGANTVLVVAAVVGSAVGLLTAGALSDSLGVGKAIALLGVFPLISIALVAWRFPETVGRELEDTSGDGPTGSPWPASPA